MSKRPDFRGLFVFSKKITFRISGFLDFWILGFFWISGYISATKRATGDPLVSKRPDFLGLFGFSKKMTFWISGFLDLSPNFFGFVDEICWICRQIFLDLSTKFFGFVDEIFWICRRNFLDLSTKFFGFVDNFFWICRRNFLDLSTKFFGFVDNLFYTRLWPAFGRQSLVGSSGGYTSHGYTSHASPRACGARLGQIVKSV